MYYPIRIVKSITAIQMNDICMAVVYLARISLTHDHMLETIVTNPFAEPYTVSAKDI